jgi:DNA-binding Lrp family transcriptional regulator
MSIKLKPTDKRVGERNYMHKLTDDDVIKIRELYATGKYRQKELAIDFNVTQEQISNIVNRRQRKGV